MSKNDFYKITMISIQVDQFKCVTTLLEILFIGNIYELKIGEKNYSKILKDSYTLINFYCNNWESSVLA